MKTGNCQFCLSRDSSEWLSESIRSRVDIICLSAVKQFISGLEDFTFFCQHIPVFYNKITVYLIRCATGQSMGSLAVFIDLVTIDFKCLRAHSQSDTTHLVLRWWYCFLVRGTAQQTLQILLNDKPERRLFLGKLNAKFCWIQKSIFW